MYVRSTFAERAASTTRPSCCAGASALLEGAAPRHAGGVQDRSQKQNSPSRNARTAHRVVPARLGCAPVPKPQGEEKSATATVSRQSYLGVVVVEQVSDLLHVDLDVRNLFGTQQRTKNERKKKKHDRGRALACEGGAAGPKLLGFV